MKGFSMLQTRSIVVDHLQTTLENENVAVACIYCDYKEQAKQTIPELVASLLKQLVNGRSTASDDVKKFYKKFHDERKSRPKLPDLIKALQSEIRTHSRVYIVVDALDECLECDQTNLMEKLRSLAGANLMVTSRLFLSIERQFQGTGRLDILANNDDVRKYIEGRIPGENRLARHVERHPTLQKDIVDSITTNVRGMSVFLILCLVLFFF
jgi:hypothetical protein